MVLLRPQEWMLLGCWNFMEFLSSRHLMDQDLETFWCLWFRSTNASWWFMVHIVICQRNWPQLYTVMTIHAEFHPPTWQPKAESLRLAISDILFREAKPSRHLRAFLGAAIGAWPQLHAGFQSEHVWKYNIYICVWQSPRIGSTTWECCSAHGFPWQQRIVSQGAENGSAVI